MSAKILDGKALSATMKKELAAQVESFKEEKGFPPRLAIFRAKEDPASVWYARAIVKTAKKAGIEAFEEIVEETAGQEKLVETIARLSADPGVHGIILQEPYPDGVDPAALVGALSPEKDVDGVHPINAGRLLRKEPSFVPATPLGGLTNLERYDIPIKGQRAVIVGRSDIVGKPMALLLLHRHATITICHSRTKNLPEVVRRADILVAAIGRAEMVRGDWIKPGAAVIDVGVNAVDDATRKRGYRLVGDVNFEEAKEVAGYLTPVPGGVGPMTIAMLMKNTLDGRKRRLGLIE